MRMEIIKTLMCITLLPFIVIGFVAGMIYNSVDAGFCLGRWWI